MLFTLVFAVIVFCSGLVCNGSDTLLANQTFCSNQTLVSKGEKFELGFFPPGNSTNYYLGIWYKNIPLQTVVWVFNRKNHIPYSYYNDLQLQLVCYDISEWYWELGGINGWVDDSSSITEAVILDTGNFVLRNGSGGIIWQSFDNPTDTWLPGMEDYFSLVSWRNPDDLAQGNYSFNESDNLTQYVESAKSRGWQRGICSALLNHSSFSNSHMLALHSTDAARHLMHHFYTASLVSRVVIENVGQVTGFGWSEARQAWIVVSSTRHLMCWSNTICNANYSPACRCLDGFVPRVQQEWDLSDFSNGCQRKMPLQCDVGKTQFVKVTVATLPPNQPSNDVCDLACSRKCSCTAFAHGSFDRCILYTGDLLAMESPPNSSVGVDIYIKTELVHTAPTKKVLVSVILPITAAVIISCFCLCYVWPKLKSKGN